ncbi:hypothetical protein [Mycolicibacterium hippocampi]|uniref:Uncharacterized protein n=1 Tax=Mycolicibacterium hippocampi TaxID=659824 RepID=A0A7I9ZP17_9MYCO|nr:hypothetical protein [Mycolicibacterium hippocampi]GFH02801.1 hypothetical protein MHIP_32840 [Mycolicibacterium hippocampi]
MPREEVELVLPGVLFGGDPRGFLDYLGLHGRPLGNNRWKVWPNNDKLFISHHLLADDTEFSNRFDHLNNMPISSPHLDDPETVARFAEMDRQLAERMSGESDIAAHFHSIQASVLKCSTHKELIEAVEQACAMLSTAAVGATNELLFAGLSAHLLIATDLLVHRVRLPAILFRFDQDTDAVNTIAGLGDEGGYFASSTKWFHGIISASHYFGPLLGCLAPGFWCIPAGRPPATILFNLGTGIAGYRHTPMEPMQLLPAEGRDEPVSKVELSPETCRVAITWWTNRLNQMFGYLCDPTTFSNKQGIYDPYEHQHWLLTFGQVFELTTAIQTLSRNYAAQRALMNTLLDSFADRIIDCDFDRLCRYDHAKDTADRVRSKMPDVVATLLMPLADRAVEALGGVRDGFFFREQRGDKNVVVRIPGSGQGHHREPPRAVAMLLKLYRNATHGFGGLRQPQNEKDVVAERLLAHHTGEMPDDLVFLPYLYLLDTLCHPDAVRRTILKRARDRD